MPRPGLTANTVARYDSALYLAARQWPRDTIVGADAIGYSLNTVAARCRDAIKAVVDGLVPHPTAEFFRRVRNELQVAIDGDQVVIRQRPSRVPAALSASAPEADYPLTINAPDSETIVAVLVLARKGHLKAPVLLRDCDPARVLQYVYLTDDIAVVAVPPNATSVM